MLKSCHFVNLVAAFISRQVQLPCVGPRVSLKRSQSRGAASVPRAAAHMQPWQPPQFQFSQLSTSSCCPPSPPPIQVHLKWLTPCCRSYSAIAQGHCPLPVPPGPTAQHFPVPLEWLLPCWNLQSSQTQFFAEPCYNECVSC